MGEGFLSEVIDVEQYNIKSKKPIGSVRLVGERMCDFLDSSYNSDLITEKKCQTAKLKAIFSDIGNTCFIKCSPIFLY